MTYNVLNEDVKPYSLTRSLSWWTWVSRFYWS